MSGESAGTVAVVGATGYAGSEAVRLLAGHPKFRVTRVTSERSAGKPLSEQCPWLATSLTLQPFVAEEIEEDFVLLCQEAGFAMTHAARLLEQGARLVDFSADFRLKSPELYEEWYGSPHLAPELLSQAVYGLTELADAEALRSAHLIANPGCYPTAALLALEPLRREGLVAGIPVIDSKSGVSGAGRSKVESDYLFAEMSGGFKAYGVVRHRHTPEIEQALGGLQVRFTPHLLPVPRGIHSTIHVPVRPGLRRSEIIDAWRCAYGNERFVSISDTPPSTKAVVGSNRCMLWAEVDERTGYAVLVSVIDNLVKGAAGQAIQNLNVMAGLRSETGLPVDGVWP
ncbi:MAG TPA: N-acetyl-gamma-glutamyl-phosphate reductase [Fimbriimonadaceae bacterium]|nr:N-acetyl-gamma-glutamyl-phosphate reductase [Fimbriimonadaceae bacterium]